MTERLKVRPEGRDGIYLVDLDSLKDWMLVFFEVEEEVHCFLGDNSNLIVGADWGMDEFESLRVAPNTKWAIVLDEDGLLGGHHLVCVKAAASRYSFDVGPLTLDDLEVVT